ncbi:DJ-1/PfpI family protein [Rhodoferax sp.]|jgi:cyclohexyl-isocyanide hydratase|uniref:DJ-1/PfpI family protein n=1 Tax=Rhodoferax sp. TaxID=50421 RepID=UPI00378452B2
MDRRYFTQMAAALGAAHFLKPLRAATAAPTDAGTAAQPTKETADAHHHAALAEYAHLTGGDKVTIGLLVYPGMFLQDLVGPLTVFEALMHRDIHLLWKNLEPVGNEEPAPAALIPVRPTTTFANCPQQLDVLFVPGGVPGTLTMMEDPEVLTFLASRGKSARFVCSVCTGSLILGAAGLLDGYRATSHWATADVLGELGAIPTKGRIVVDRNRITGGGVTAGIDFGLAIAANLRSETYAKAIQLYLEYDPAPPFDAGAPEKAPRVVVNFLNEMFAGMRKAAFSVARRARAKW